MITKFYEVRCDYCDWTINHYPRVKPSLDILRRDGEVLQFREVKKELIEEYSLTELTDGKES